MSSKGYQTLFVAGLFIFNTQNVLGDHTSRESQPHYEYIQIFRSIPALFEYLLSALEERPEILEKNDVTVFNRNMQVAETDECSDSGRKTDKRGTDCDNTKTQNENIDTNNVDRRDTSDAKDSSGTTVSYEYGNSNIMMEDLGEIESNKDISKLSLVDEKIMKRETLKTKNTINGRKNINMESKLDNDIFQDYKDAFYGFENLFGLDLKPEEIEERILMAEQLLEEHNNKKDTKV